MLICFLSLLTTAGRNRKNCLTNASNTTMKLKCQAKNPSTEEKGNEIDLLSPLHFFVLSI